MIFLLVAAALVVGAPLVAVVLVTIASLREDSERSLGGRPPGLLAAAVRRLLCFGQDRDSVSRDQPVLPPQRQATDEESTDWALTPPRS